MNLEPLEDRTLLSIGFNPNPTDAAQLSADISYANSNPGSYTITLSSSDSYLLSNTTGALPTIAAKVNLTIDGNGAAISRDSSASAFRLFDVASGATLDLENLTLSGGLAQGTGTAAEGGAIYSSGGLTLKSVTVKSNEAQGSNGGTLIRGRRRLQRLRRRRVRVGRQPHAHR